MTATPSMEELLAVTHAVERDYRLSNQNRATILYALRLAAKPADEGVREATIEACARVADDFTEPMDVGRRVLRKQQSPEWFKHLAATEIANAIRALSTTGEPKR